MEIVEIAKVEVAAPADEAFRATAPDWYVLLDEAVKEPGQLSAAHKFFHVYSLANRWLASLQLRAAGLPLTPINTFNGWRNVNRMVQKGQKAIIALNMPMNVKGKKKDEDEEVAGKGKTSSFTRFMLRRAWFALSQTDGEDFNMETFERNEWNYNAVLTQHELTYVPFEFTGVTDVNRPDFATKTTVSVSPIEVDQEFLRLRAVARVLLGHCDPVPSKSVPTDDMLRDVEADAAAYLVAATLGISGLESARARLQLHLGTEKSVRIPDRSAHRAFSAADKMLNAGYC